MTPLRVLSDNDDGPDYWKCDPEAVLDGCTSCEDESCFCELMADEAQAAADVEWDIPTKEYATDSWWGEMLGGEG